MRERRRTEQPTTPQPRTTVAAHRARIASALGLVILVVGLVVALTNLVDPGPSTAVPVASTTSASQAPSTQAPGHPVPRQTGAPQTTARPETAPSAPTDAGSGAPAEPGSASSDQPSVPSSTGPRPEWATVARSDFDGNRLGDDVHLYDDVPDRYRQSNVDVGNGQLEMHVTGETGAALWLGRPITYGRVNMRVEVEGASGNGAAVMLWPVSDNAAEGEMDFAEGDFDAPIKVFHHRIGTDHKKHESTSSTADWHAWHDVSIEWTPGQVRYLVDGAVVQAETDDIPSTPHRLTLQLDNIRGGASAGTLLVDSYRIDQLR